MIAPKRIQVNTVDVLYPFIGMMFSLHTVSLETGEGTGWSIRGGNVSKY